MVQPDSGSVLLLSSLVLHNIAQGIFETIVEQAPLAIEELMNELEEEELSEEDELSEEVEELSEEEAQERGVLFREPPKGEDCTLHGDSLSWSQLVVDPYLPLLSHPLTSALTPQVCSQCGSWADLGNKYMCCSLSQRPLRAPRLLTTPQALLLSPGILPAPLRSLPCVTPALSTVSSAASHSLPSSLNGHFCGGSLFGVNHLKLHKSLAHLSGLSPTTGCPAPPTRMGAGVSLALGAGPAGSSWWRKRVRTKSRRQHE